MTIPHKVMHIVGARPNFVKVGTILQEASLDKGLNYIYAWLLELEKQTKL